MSTGRHSLRHVGVRGPTLWRGASAGRKAAATGKMTPPQATKVLQEASLPLPPSRSSQMHAFHTHVTIAIQFNMGYVLSQSCTCSAAPSSAKGPVPTTVSCDGNMAAAFVGVGVDVGPVPSPAPPACSNSVELLLLLPFKPPKPLPLRRPSCSSPLPPVPPGVAKTFQAIHGSKLRPPIRN